MTERYTVELILRHNGLEIHRFSTPFDSGPPEDFHPTWLVTPLIQGLEIWESHLGAMDAHRLADQVKQAKILYWDQGGKDA